MKKIKLKHPIQISGKEVTEISLLRRPKARDLEAMDKAQGPVGKTIMLMSNLLEFTPDEVRELDAEDFNAIESEINSFLF